MSYIKNFSLLSGITVEWFENMLFLLLIPQIGRLYFKDGIYNEIEGMIPFCIGFLSTIFGSYYFGNRADKIGRIFSIKNTPVIMFISSIIMALIPTYNIFNYSWIALILMRLIQRFIVSGEKGVVSVYIYEIANAKSKYRHTALSNISILVGIILATYFVGIFSKILSDEMLFRSAFFLSSIFSLFVFCIRRIFLNENNTNIKINPVVNEVKISSIIKYSIIVIVLWLPVTLSFFYMFNFLPFIFTKNFNFSNSEILKNLSNSLIFQIPLLYIIAIFCDKIKSNFTLMLLSYFLPILMYFISFLFFGKLVQLYIYDIGYVLAPAIIQVVVIKIIPFKYRCTSLNIGFNSIVAIFSIISLPIYKYLYSYGKIISFTPVIFSYIISISFFIILFKLRINFSLKKILKGLI